MKPALLLMLLIPCGMANAQLTNQCNGADQQSIYFSTSSGFYRVDSVDINPTTPVMVGTNTVGTGGGIALTNNLNTGSGNVDMYLTDYNGHYHYWDGMNWINTNVLIPNPSAINIGGTYNYIYNHDGVNGVLYRFNGSNSVTLFSYPAGSSNTTTYDVAADQDDNIYMMFNSEQIIAVFDPSGVAIDTFTMTGFPTGNGSGMAIVGNSIYATASSNLYRGTVSGSNVAFSHILVLPFSVLDIAACPQSANVLAVVEMDKPYAQVYPNPASDVAVIKLRNVERIQVFDMMGRLATEESIKDLSEFILPVAHLPEGGYIIRAFNGLRSNTAKLLVRH